MKKTKLFFLLICLFLPLTFAGCENVGSETLSTPANFKVETNGIISFEMVDNAEYYTIMINGTSLNVFPNADENNQVTRVDNVLMYDASRIFVLGESYDVKVQAKGEQKASNFSNEVSYTHAVKIDKAENIKFNGTILTWDAVEHANFYVIKVLAPYDKVADDSASNVSKLDITEYHFSTNRFDFSSLTTSAGEYKFYINAVSLENNRISSGYTNKTVYSHKINLQTPQNSGVHKISEYNSSIKQMEDSYHLLTVVDEFANAINVKIGSSVETVYLNSNDANIKLHNEYLGVSNVVDINLSTLFANSVNLSGLTNFQVSAQAIYETAQEKNYYVNSKYSSEVDVLSLGKVETPEIELVQNATTGEYQLTWNMKDETNISGFAIYIGTPEGVEVVQVNSNTKAFLLPENFISASVQAIGKGNYFSSNISEQATTINNKDNSVLKPQVSASSIRWNEVENATYIVEIDNEVVVTTDTYLNISSRKKAIEHFVITIVRDGYAPLRTEYDASTIKRGLGTPNIRFNSNSLYVLEFNKVQNAIGYYVYLNNKKIQKLFTTNVINLSNYLTGGQTYTVKVQAVADVYSIFKNGNMSNSVNVTHQQQLEKPTFIENENGIPVSKVVEGNQTKYILKFKGVNYANGYEILVNYNSLPYAKSGSGEHEVDVSSLITSAGKYTIMVRALPSDSDLTVKPSEYAIFDECIITEQLPPVEGVKVTLSEGKYTVSFETQTNAEKYLVKIIKINDENYMKYLEGIGLSNTLETIGACDISAYVLQEGRYLVYVTALAASGGFYANSDESNSFAELNKLNTLYTPFDFEYKNTSSTEYSVEWYGDKNADYFIVNVVDPYNISHEYIIRNISPDLIDDNEEFVLIRCNINDSLSVQGAYNVKIKALVDTSSENAISYSNSPYSEVDTFIYEHKEAQDFERTSVTMYGTTNNYVVKNLEQLKNILWYNYLYQIDSEYNLKFMLSPKADETTVEMLVRLAEGSTNYKFNEDAEWKDIIKVGDDGQYVNSDTDVLTAMVERLINIYPELHILEGLSVQRESNNVFKLYYKNALNVEKVDSPYESVANDYVGTFAYITEENRRAENTAFAIDQLTKTMNVETTEQLLHAVQYGFRPVFVGNCEIAQTVYENAKAVLLKIVSSNMTDLEKTTAIFDWLAYAINFNYEATYYTNTASEKTEGTNANLDKFGNRKEFYLEGVFLGLFTEENRTSDGEFFFTANKTGTSESYSKAFTLLCAIEGIETRKVNANYAVDGTEVKFTKHSYNIVNLKVNDEAEKVWFAVDGTFSDTTSYNSRYASSVGSHIFFLVSVNEIAEFIDIGTAANNQPNKKITIVNDIFDPTCGKYVCGENYNFYASSNFKIKREELKFLGLANRRNLDYSNQFIKEVNASSSGYFDFGLLQTDQTESASMEAYILNQLIYGYCQLQKDNSTGYVRIEFRFNHADNNNIDNVEDYLSTPLTKLNNALTGSYKDIEIGNKYYKKHIETIENEYIEDGDVKTESINIGYTTCVITMRLK